MIPALLIWADAATTIPPPIDGARLGLGDACYTILSPGADGKAAGEVLRRVERMSGDRLRLSIVSRVNGGPLLTSRMVVAFPSLRPISTTEWTDGKTSLSVRYDDTMARGKVSDESGHRRTSTASLPWPVWDGETLDFVVTTLPLAEGAHFELPIFHFGRGPGVATVDVRGSVALGGISRGPVPSWKVEASTRSGMTITYFIARADRRLMAVEVGDVRSHVGGDCSALGK